MAGEADQRVLPLVPRHYDAVVDPRSRRKADKAVLAARQLEDNSTAIVIGTRLAPALVIDDQQRIARCDEFSAEAIPEQLDVAFALAGARISLRPLAAVALDVGCVAEGGEQVRSAASCARAGVARRATRPNTCRRAAQIVFVIGGSDSRWEKQRVRFDQRG